MRCFVERTPIATGAAFSLTDLKEHVIVEADDTDELLRVMGGEAVAEFEGLASVALLRQRITVTLLGACLDCGISLPVGPLAPDSGATVSLDGQSTSEFDLVPGRRPYLSWRSSLHGSRFDKVVIEYEAGFGDDAIAVPEDIRYAIMDQAVVDFDDRGTSGKGSFSRSSSLSRVAARYRGVGL